MPFLQTVDKRVDSLFLITTHTTYKNKNLTKKKPYLSGFPMFFDFITVKLPPFIMSKMV